MFGLRLRALWGISALVSIAWAGGTAPVLLTGPAVTVFDGEIEL